MSSPSAKAAPSLSDIVNEATTGRAKGKTAVNTNTKPEARVSQDHSAAEKFKDIMSNPFAKIMFDTHLSPEEKKVALIEAEKATKDKAVNKQRAADNAVFKEYLQLKRQEVSQALISLTDTEAFSELRSVYKEINEALMEFDAKMKPLTDIVDAVFAIRMHGENTVFEIFEEIKNDEAEEARRAAILAQQETDMARLLNEKAALESNKIALGQDKILGLFGIKKASRIEIAKIEQLDLPNKVAEIDQQIALMETTKTDFESPLDSKFAELGFEKSKFRELLDISSEAHKERQLDLVNAANNFVNSTSARVGSVLTHLEGRSGHIEKLSDMTFQMRDMYAILSEAETEAQGLNVELSKTLETPEQSESPIDAIKREESLRTVNDHISATTRSLQDTGSTYSELQQAGFQITNMKKGNEEQIETTRTIQSSGVAGVAQRLATTLDALSGAALAEGSEMVKAGVIKMQENTNRVLAKDALRQAGGLMQEADALTTATESLRQMKAVITKTSDMTREGIAAAQHNLEGLKTVADEIGEATKQFQSVARDVAGDKTDKKPVAKETAAPEAPKQQDPFANFQP